VAKDSISAVGLRAGLSFNVASFGEEEMRAKVAVPWQASSLPRLAFFGFVVPLGRPVSHGEASWSGPSRRLILVGPGQADQ
jgi:hypothetical protein